MDSETYFERDASVVSYTAAIYLLLFIVPATSVFLILNADTAWGITETSIVTVSILNASINSVIAYLTIRLDGKSNDTLDHLDVVIEATEELDDTLKDANHKVTSFTTDLDEAKAVFQRVGVNLTELDLEPVAEVVEKLKENKDGLNEVLDNLREVDVTEYIQQAKRIDWKQLLDAAEEILTFIQARPKVPQTTTADIMQKMKLPRSEPIQIESDEEWGGEEDWEFNKEEEEEWDGEEPELTEPYEPPTITSLKRNKLSLKRR